MDEEELRKEVERIAEEEAENIKRPVNREYEQKKTNSPLIMIGGLLLVLLIILMVIPYHWVKSDPPPKNVPGMEVLPKNLEAMTEQVHNLPYEQRANYKKMMFTDNAAIRILASRIITQSCEGGEKICQAKALFQWVRDNFQYISDPRNGYLENPFETMQMGGADCDGTSILLANLLGSVGFPIRFVFIPNHVYVQVLINKAPGKYKETDGWINADATCSSCEFGEIPYSTGNRNREYLYV